MCWHEVDARGAPSRLAAVLFVDDAIFYTDGAPSKVVLARFRERRDNQITSTEMLSISMGLATFAQELHQRKVIVYSDNRGAEVNIGSGGCAAHASMLLSRCVGSDAKRLCARLGPLHCYP